jgi:hypothetical protein
MYNTLYRYHTSKNWMEKHFIWSFISRNRFKISFENPGHLYVGYIVVVSFIGGENHGLAASYWQALSHYVVSSTLRHERDSNSQLQLW